MKFRMNGNIIELLRYDISYTDNNERVIRSVASQGELENLTERLDQKEIEYNVTEIVQPEYEWLDGMTVSGLKEAYDLAEIGEEAYNAPTPQEDIDAMLIDLEYRLTLLELGTGVQ